MTWFKVDDSLAFHRKTVAAGNAAMGMWVRAGSWSSQQLTDGFIPNHIVDLLGTVSQRQKLIRASLWIEVEGGVQFHEWNENGRQPTSETVRKDRERSAERQAKWRATRAERAASSAAKVGEDQPVSESSNGVSNRCSNGVSHGPVTPFVTGAPTRPDPTRPVLPTEVREDPPVADAPPPPGAKRETKANRVEGFADFWDAYPRKIAKQAAEKAYTAAIKRGAEPAEILTAARRFATASAGSEARFVPHPTTWLNQGRYDDEPSTQLALVPGTRPAAPARPVEGTSTQRMNAILALRKGS